MEQHEVSKYQKFEIVTVNRQDIKKAEYNPRKISDDAKRKLRKNIERVGLLDTIVVNKNTMNIVSGHQRIGVLDALEHRKNYNLQVAMVDLTEKEEVEQNIFFNNPKTQGDFDIDSLASLSKGIDIESTGFDFSDMAIFGIDDHDIFKTEEEYTEPEKKLLRLGNEIYDNKHQLRKDMQKVNDEKNRNENDTYVILSFKSHRAKCDFLQRFDFAADNKYVNGDMFSEMIERVE